MKFLLLTLLVAYASAKPHILSSETVDQINRVSETWTAHHYFKEHELDEVRSKLGTFFDERQQLPEVNETEHFDFSLEVPAEFDARKQWPACASIISDVRDQANCGSCWAFGAVGAMSDRICIASNGQKKVRVSADDLLSCCTSCGFGCRGGYVPKAWNYWVQSGLVSGGNWGETDTCRPYEIEPCGERNKKNPKHKCRGTASTPRCRRQCVNGANYNQDKTYGSKAYTLRGEENIKREVLQNGPVEVAFKVYADFLQYKSGVYKATSNQLLGGHAVRLIGWGEENGTPYWLIANSWSDLWGENGYFRIVRGSDHCGIESLSVGAGLPRL